MILYSYFRSSAAYRVRIALHLKKIPFEYRPVHLVKDGGQHNKDEYKKLNPMGQVPCLVDGDLALSQSMAILMYLDRNHPSPRLFPEDAKELAKVIQVCEIVNSGIHPIQNLRVMQYLDEKFAIGADGKAAWAAHWIRAGFEGLEKTLEKYSGAFSVGDTLSAADLFIVPQVFNAHRFKVDMKPFPRLSKIEKKCLEIEAFQQAVPDRQPDSE